MLTKTAGQIIEVELLRFEGDRLVSGDRNLPADPILDEMVKLQLYLGNQLGETLNRTSIRAGIKGMLANPHYGQFLIAWSKNNQVMGQVEVKKIFEVWDNAPYFYLDNYVVFPAYQGLGVGRSMLEAAERLARKERAKCLRLYVAHDNPGAREFYTSNGFSSHGELMEYPIRSLTSDNG